MRATALALGAIAAAACGGTDEGSAFDLGIEVHADGVRIRHRHLANPPCEPQEYFPALGECTIYSDVFSDNGEPATCFTRVAIERAGTELGEADSLQDCIGGIGIVAPGIFDAPGTTLVLEGCGTTIALPLPPSAAPEPNVLDLTTDGEWLYFDHDAGAAATGVFGLLTYGLSSDACHVSSAGLGRVPAGGIDASGDLYVSGVIDGGVHPTPWGSASVWSVRSGAFVDGIIAPARGVDDTWAIGGIGFELVVDGSVEPTVSASGWQFSRGPGGVLLHQLRGVQLEYTAGEVTDALRVLTLDGIGYAGTFPHVTPTNELDFAFAGDDRFELAIGPVDLQLETNPSVTRTVELSIAWTHPHIARPE
jgi:hypothetical protein